jgi:hypothetical protein
MKKKTIILWLLLAATPFVAFPQEKTDVFTQKTGRLLSLTEGGILAGNSNNENKAPFIFHSSLNYVFLKQLSVGAGAGVEFFKETHLPVTANVLYQFGSKRIIPYLKLQAGYLFALENKMNRNGYYYYPYGFDYIVAPSYTYETLDSRGGLMIDPSLGIMIRSDSDWGITLSVGYRHQKLKYESHKDDGNYYARYVEYNRISFKIGFIF